MKTSAKVALSAGSVVLLATIAIATPKFFENKLFAKAEACCEKPKIIEEKPCVFMSVMGEQSVEGFAKNKFSKEVEKTISDGEKWLVSAQNQNGGWGAGSQVNQS